MSKQSLNFKELNEALLPYIYQYVVAWIPGGKQLGKEYQAGSIHGGPGKSFSVNLHTGQWSDFAVEGQSGGDIISLYATINNISQIDSAKALSELINFSPKKDPRLTLPDMKNKELGKPSAFWVYKNKQGFPTHLAIRYDPLNDKKTFRQCHYDHDAGKWSWKATRETPLYNLDRITSEPEKKIVVCEGEKAAEAANLILSPESYIATSWMGGSKATGKVNLSPLVGRNVILWPDADKVGVDAMNSVFAKISTIAETIKFIIPFDTDEKGMDAADLLGIPREDAIEWIKQRIKQLKPLDAELVENDQESNEREVSPSVENEVDLPKETSSAVTKFEEEMQGSIKLARLSDRWINMRLQMKPNQTPYETEDNILRILTFDPVFKNAFFFDEFFKQFYTNFHSIGYRPIDDTFVTQLKIYLQRHYLFCKAGTNQVKDAMKYFFSTIPIKNQMAERSAALTWDHTPRVDMFLQDIYGAEDNEYTRAASRIFWLSMLKRTIKPGIKVDTVIILEGAQGLLKSSSLELIAGKQYATSGKDISGKDFYLKMKAKSILEIAELNGFSKADHNELKELVSTATDEFRVPYGIEVQPHPRTCIFVGTTNDKNYLTDETGARRYLPIACSKVEMQLLSDNLDQYYAEAYKRAVDNENHWDYPKDIHREITNSRMADDKDVHPWDEDIESWVLDVQVVKTKTILAFVLNITDARFHDKKASIRIGKVMRKLGYKYGAHRPSKEIVYKAWIRDVQYPCHFQTCADKISSFRPDPQKVLPPLRGQWGEL